jgi:hypothetical protein
VSPASIIVSPDKAAVTVTASEPNYTGLIYGAANCNPTEVQLLPPVSLGPVTPFVFTFEGAPAGPAPGHDQCTAQFDGGAAAPATVDIAVIGYTMIQNPVAATISISNPQPVTLTVTETGYKGDISIANPDQQVLTIKPLAAAGPKATFTISLATGYKGGATEYSLEISDSFNEFVFMKLSIVN